MCVCVYVSPMATAAECCNLWWWWWWWLVLGLLIQPYIGSSVKDSDVEELEKAGMDGEQAMEMNTREKNEKWLAQLFQGTTVEPGAQSALAPMLDKESITALDNFMQRYNNVRFPLCALPPVCVCVCVGVSVSVVP